MDNTGFIELCKGAAAALPQSRTRFSAGTCEFNIKDVSIGLFFDEIISNDRIICFVDIGTPPTQERENILGHFLSLNLLTSTKTSGVYGMDIENDKLFFIQHLLYPELLDSDELASLLSDYSFHATELRATLIDFEGNTLPGLREEFSMHSQVFASAGRQA